LLSQVGWCVVSATLCGLLAWLTPLERPQPVVHAVEHPLLPSFVTFLIQILHLAVVALFIGEATLGVPASSSGFRHSPSPPYCGWSCTPWRAAQSQQASPPSSTVRVKRQTRPDQPRITRTIDPRNPRLQACVFTQAT
jgi:hypothetical protein